MFGVTKATDELLFLGDAQAARQSYERQLSGQVPILMKK
jgi:hypothetical protein